MHTRCTYGRRRLETRFRLQRNRCRSVPGRCQGEGMAKILPFPRSPERALPQSPGPGRTREPARGPAREPEREPERATVPLWRELLGRSLRATREEHGGRLVDVAKRAGISPQYLSEIERGRKEPSSEMIAAITGALGIDLADMLTEVADEIRRPRGATAATGRHPAGPVLMAA
jgi:ribosome-binding protein aMBF1 (putative translation factor)